jgi:hypothetical protein
MQDTAINNTSAQTRYNKPILYFLLIWTALNILQSCALELHADEAYYWVYSRMMDWGFYYHPPMVAVFIRMGDMIMHNELGVRLATILASTSAIYLIWQMLKRYEVSARWFIVLISSIWVFHIYGFIATPDSPLLFFAVLFYFFYQRYLDKDSWLLALILGVVVACLMYSKYHGILLVTFTLLANLKLLKRPSFYFIVLLALGLYVPHILWQYHHGFPALNVNLFERDDTINFTFGFTYLGMQLLLGGAFTSWFLFYKGFTTKVQDVFMRTMLVNAIGIFVFFYLNTFKVDVQPHYTLIGFVPLVMLTLIHFKQDGKNPPAWFYKLSMANIALFVVFRICTIIGFDFLQHAPQLSTYYGFHKWADEVHAKAGDAYVVMRDEYQNPSKYDFYTNSLKGFGYDSKYYRTTQFDMWPFEDEMQHKKVYFLTDTKVPGVTTDSINNLGKWYGGWITDTRTYQKVVFKPASYILTGTAGGIQTINLDITNPYPFAIGFSNEGVTHQLSLEACLFLGTQQVDTQKGTTDFYNITIQPGQQAHYKFPFKVPMKKGLYQLYFSLRTDPFAGSRNSGVIKFTVK